MLGVALILLSSCVKYEDKATPFAPQIAFGANNETPTKFDKETGDYLKVTPIVIGGEDIAYEWKLGTKVISTDPKIFYELTDAGTFTLYFSAKNQYGEVKQQFAVNVTEARVPGVGFSTAATAFTKSIGENLKITATTREGTTAEWEKWEVNSTTVSNDGELNYAILTAGAYTVKYTIKKTTGDEFSTTFSLTAIKSPYGNWFVLQDGETYVICLKSDPTKVLAHYAGNNVFSVETYIAGNNQKWRKGNYFGYGDANVQLEFYNFYNLGTKGTPVNNGNFATVNVAADGTCGTDGWLGWYFPVDASGNVRIVHFLETWDSADAMNPAYGFPGALIRLNDSKTQGQIFNYGRFAGGVRDRTEYNNFGANYYDFKIVNVKDLE